MVAFQWAVACNIWTHCWKVMGFWRFQPKFGHALSHCECMKICPKLPKFAKICPKMKLWNTTKKRDFNVFQKYKFLRVEEALKHVSTVRIFNPRINHMLFLLSKNGLCMWISAYPLVENNFFLNVRLLLWMWDFAHMYLTQLGTRMWSPASHIYVQKWFFGPLKHSVPLGHSGKKLFFLLWI
jgi:hypothetical protein